MKNLEAHFKEIKKQYPKTMSKDQLYRVAHISKATALYLLQSGAIPCKDTGKKTRRYTIKTDDVIEYLRQREICPEKYKASEGWYTARNMVETCDVLFTNFPGLLEKPDYKDQVIEIMQEPKQYILKLEGETDNEQH